MGALQAGHVSHDTPHPMFYYLLAGAVSGQGPEGETPQDLEAA